MGSLFDGIGGFPLVASRCDIEPLWASEIEPFPMLFLEKIPSLMVKFSRQITHFHQVN